jgi:hypothetical protein
MELEEVLADHDSEDEIDDDIADFEDMTVKCDKLLAPLKLIIFACFYIHLYKYLILVILILLRCSCLMVFLMLQKMRSKLCICGIHLFGNKGQACPQHFLLSSGYHST